MNILQQLKSSILVSIINFLLLREANCYLRPYYIHFPPPPIPVHNALGPIGFPQPWTAVNSSISRSFPIGNSLPVVVHTWVKPDTSERIKLENGTIIYYVSPPWGGFRTSSPSSSPPHATTAVNSLTENDFSTLSPGENEIERQGLFEDPTRQSGGYKNSIGNIVAANIDITTPPSSKIGGSWNNGPTTTQISVRLPAITSTTATTTNPTKAPVGVKTTTAPNYQTPTTRKSTTDAATTSTTPDPVADSTNAKYPVSESVRKFRRIVAQIRAITKKELTVPRKNARS